MSQASTQDKYPTPWLLLLGLGLGGVLLLYMLWDAWTPTPKKTPRNADVPIVELNESNWQKEVIESKIPVLVDFSAEWCGPCRAFAPVIERLAERFAGKVKVCSFDVGDNTFSNATNLARQYQFNAVPTIMIFKNGELQKKIVGSTSESRLVNLLEPMLAQAPSR